MVKIIGFVPAVMYGILSIQLAFVHLVIEFGKTHNAPVLVFQVGVVCLVNMMIGT
jgi:hypothetical protein